MTVPLRPPSLRISAVLSDVDGTLLTSEKILTDRAQAAVAALHASGIAFAIISARPPRGMTMLIEPLAIVTPVTGFNGGIVVTPALTPIEQHLIDPIVARRAVELITARGAQPWVFSGQEWLVLDPKGPYVDHEEYTVRFPPTVVVEFGSRLDTAAKIVGVSADFEVVAQIEREGRALLADVASVARSQLYYLDVTHKLANKGDALLALAEHLAIPREEIATIGDGGNDVAMFAQSGLGIAMGNASDEVKAQAHFVTDSNQEDGFAKAVERFFIHRTPGNAASP
jgi:Cof subfamily protein (haloacid dehalogenase superfamily)